MEDLENVYLLLAENLSGARTSHYGYVKVENSKREER